MSGGKLSLDDYMRLLWTEHGKPGGSTPGLVGKPYSLKDLRQHLATLSGNRQFADEFFDRFVEGREAPDYARLLGPAGYTVRGADAGRGWIGDVNVAETPNGLAIGGAGGRGNMRPSPVPFNTPLYEAGIDAGDTIKTIDGQPATLAAWNAIASRSPGEKITMVVVRRGGVTVTKQVVVRQDPTVRQIVPVSNPTEAQKKFRDSWLSTKVK